MTEGRPLFRVLLVEDDDSIRRYVAMALEDAEIDLVLCTDVPQALQALRQAPAQLVISDLMLPGESGMVLLEQLSQDDALRAGACLAVFSAGVRAEVREQLQRLGIWRILSKPASLAELQACVEDAMRLQAGTGAPTAAAPVMPRASAEADVVERYYGGDRELYASYHAMCVNQFATDLHTGDTACTAGDLPALRRLSHSLKTVLQTLGYAELSELALRIEQAAAASDAEAWALWQSFRPAFALLAQPSASLP